jgi:glycosyltransferase involved in cell wall biosynthesis
LARLLEALNALIFHGSVPEIDIVVVDNDPLAGARAACELWRRTSRWPLLYIVEPQPGIAPARNAALDNVGGVDFICFVDDDEVPEPGWLAELIRVQTRYDADVVGGPVVPYFPQSVPDWVLRGCFFRRRRHPTGTRLSHAFTNNVLFRKGILDEMGLRFDGRWALAGCEDRHFFQRIGMSGYKIVWADEAIVTEWVPAERATARWLIRRHYRVGNSTSLIESDLQSRWTIRLLLACKGLAWLVIGSGLLATSSFLGKRGLVRALRACAYGAGLLTGLLGIRFEEYRRVAQATEHPQEKQNPVR